MIQSKPFFSKTVMSALTVALTSGAVLGNGSVLAIIARFKSLRTVPNIFIGNLAAVDLLNAAINMPIHMMYTVLEASWYRGQTLAIMTTFFNRLFLILNLASMLALLLNLYFGIAFDLAYFAWKTRQKALACACLIWFIGTVLTILYSIPLLKIDLGDVPVTEYRAEIFKQGKHFFAAFIAFFIVSAAVLGLLTTWSIKNKKKKRAEMNLPALQAQARLRNDIKATKTIAITVGAYFFCYVPVGVYSVLGRHDGSQIDSWLAFLSWYALFFSTAVNPIIYSLRTSRFRSAFKQFLKDPFGSSDFKEKSCGLGQGREKPNPKRVDAKGGNDDGNSSEFQADRSQARPTFLRERQNEAQLFNQEAGETSEERRMKQQREVPGCNTGTLPGPIATSSFSSPRLMIKRRKACSSILETRKSRDGKSKDIEEKDEVCEKSGLENGSRKGKRHSRKKIDPISMGESGYQTEEKWEGIAPYPQKTKMKDILGRRRNAITPACLPNQAWQH